MDSYSKDELNRRMNGAAAALKAELAGLRTGRASPALLDPVKVEAYGNPMPIGQIGTVSTPEPRLLTVQVWDRGLVKAVDKAIRDAGLGLNPQIDSTPRSSDASTVRWSARAPARCPAATGSPRFRAQRPFPSMMMATWRGRSAIEILLLGISHSIRARSQRTQTCMISCSF